MTGIDVKNAANDFHYFHFSQLMCHASSHNQTSQLSSFPSSLSVFAFRGCAACKNSFLKVRPVVLPCKNFQNSASGLAGKDEGQKQVFHVALMSLANNATRASKYDGIYGN